MAVIVVAVISAGASLRKVSVTPLGVAKNETPQPLHWSRLLPIVLVGFGFAAAWNTGQGGLAALIIFLVLGIATLNLIGPLLISVFGRIHAARAKDLPNLLAARRLISNPKTGWRSVGGVALATFIAGITSASTMLASTSGAYESNTEEYLLMLDIGIGGLLTLTIAALVAAVSTGVLQSGQVIDQRENYRTLLLAGTDDSTLEKARMLEARIPLFGAVGLATAVVSVFLLPIFGMTIFTSVPALIQYLVSIAVASALVMLGAKSSSLIAKKIAPIFG